ncbi:lactate/malate dehydrogenase [Dipodascopsis tothii]|uniref:lactate/malate dehydrogenase n=1 Tax=Dipodascopsis tothii TaxID=44089 RepID=UPI0034CD72E9
MVKAVVAGAGGGIGQPLSLLLKLSPYVTELALYDVVGAPGVATDLSHISTPAVVTGYLPADDGMKKAFLDADIILIPAGIPRKPGMTRDDLFKINAGIVRDLVTAAALYAPKAFLLVISNPVNSTVPIAAEVLKKHGVFDPAKLFGITTLDLVRAETFTARLAGGCPAEYKVPVIGGHSGDTIVPLISKATPAVSFSTEKLEALVKRIQFGGDEVVQAKEGKGSATLSMAHAGFRFAESVLKAVKTGSPVTENAFVYLPGIPGGSELQAAVGVDFFSSTIEIGPSGTTKVLDTLAGITEYEQGLLKVAVEGLKPNIAKGVDFIVSAEAK